MVTSKLLLEYKNAKDDETLEFLIYRPLDALLLAAAKYNTLPIGIIQFLISRINFQPVIILTVYDDKAFMSNISKIDNKLNIAMCDGSISDSVSPTVIIFPTKFRTEDIIYSYADLYYYSSAYIVDLKGLKEGLKKKEIIRYAVYTDSAERRDVGCNIESLDDIGLVKLPESKKIPVKLPFRNITKYNKYYEDIVSAIMGNDATAVSKEEIEAIYESLKNEQNYNINGIYLFKDFMKQKPLSLTIYSSLIKGEVNIRTVCLRMDFNTKLTHMVFYRYIDGVVDKIIGTMEEVRENNGK
jgi:hypothetical protein